MRSDAETTSTCPNCGGQLQRKNGKYGEFWGCERFPKCRFATKRAPETNAPTSGPQATTRAGKIAALKAAVADLQRLITELEQDDVSGGAPVHTEQSA